MTDDRNIIKPDEKRQNFNEITEDELALYWTLSDEQIGLTLNTCRGDNYYFICFAAQICSLRDHGVFIDNYSTIPYLAIQYISKQLELNLVDMLPSIISTDREYHYRQKITQYLAFKNFDA